MNISNWARIQTKEVIKKLILILTIFFIPIFCFSVAYIQFLNIKSVYTSSKKLLLVSLQTGDLVNLRRTLAGYEDNLSVVSYKLFDSSGVIVHQSQKNIARTVNFSSSFDLYSSDNYYWGKLIIVWGVPLTTIVIFVLYSCIFIFIVATVIFYSWKKFSDELLVAIQQLKNFVDHKEPPEFISKVSELNSVFEQLKLSQENILTVTRLQAQREGEAELLVLTQQVAHDLRSPLSVISLVCNSLSLQPEQHELIQGATLRLNEICSELLRERKSLIVSEYSIEEEFNQIIKEFKAININSNILFDLDSQSLKTISVLNGFKSVVSNLLNNSIESLKENSGHIILRAFLQDEFLIINIIDNGIGIPDHILFDLGTKPITFGKNEIGNGLGLFGAKQWAKKNQGDLLVSSKLGFGTEVLLKVKFHKRFN